MMSAIRPSMIIRRRYLVDDGQVQRTTVGELVGTVQSQREHRELNIDNSRTRLKV